MLWIWGALKLPGSSFPPPGRTRLGVPRVLGAFRSTSDSGYGLPEAGRLLPVRVQAPACNPDDAE